MRLALVGALAAVVLAAALVVVGRWEGDRHSDAENRGIARVRRLVGPLDSPSLSAFRLLPRFSCLVYRRSGEQFALELCMDRDGRVVEAIDRRSATPRIWSLREQPSAADVRVDRGEVDRLIKKLQAEG
jgi:hypothetical protein